MASIAEGSGDLACLMLRPSFALDCHYTLHIAIADFLYLLIGGHRRSERLGPNTSRQGQ
jgi:hypothetical protein